MELLENRRIGERLVQLRKLLKQNSRRMALSIDADPSYYAKAEKGSGLSENLLQKIITKFNVNRNWLLFGEGDPLKHNGAITPISDPTNRAENQDLYMKVVKKFETYQPIPVYDVDIAASNLELYDDKSALPEDFYYIPEFSGCRAFNVYSDSMEPLIPKGSRIFARRIDDWQTVLEYGQVYAVGLMDGRRFIKYVKKAESKEDFRLVSENDFYDDFDVPKNKVRSIWLIDGWMNKHTQSTFFVLKDNKKQNKT